MQRVSFAAAKRPACRVNSTLAVKVQILFNFDYFLPEIFLRARWHCSTPNFEVVQLDDYLKKPSPWEPRNRRRNPALKRILITGGAGFVGSHLVDSLMNQGHEVIVVDNFYTGSRRNVEHWIGHSRFALVQHDVVVPFYTEVDEIYHLASPASPVHYMSNPVKTIKANTIGTLNLLGLARKTGARFLLASTSEVYGDAQQHPQSETYFGNVNPIGPRSCYDESKRLAESLTFAYKHRERVDTRVARIFNTFGSRMQVNDGRVVSNFIVQALQSDEITMYGDGSQTRSFMYVSDLVAGLEKLMASNYTLPVNIGNPQERTVRQLAEIILDLVHKNSSYGRSSRARISSKPPLQDDPKQRRPNIDRAKTILHWEPKVDFMDGLAKTIPFFQQQLQKFPAATIPVIPPPDDVDMGLVPKLDNDHNEKPVFVNHA